jgi:hypothetical protein
MNMNKHVRACLQAMLSDKQMQVRPGDDAAAWVDGTVRDALACLAAAPECVRVKPEPQVMCEMAGIRFPVPMREAPKMGVEVWYVASSSVMRCTWADHPIDRNRLDSCLCQATEAGAIAQSLAMQAALQEAIEGAK